VLIDAGSALAEMSLRLAVHLRVTDAVTGRDLGPATRVDVKIGDGWSLLSEDRLSRLVTGAEYDFRFEHDRYYPAILPVSVARHQALLLLEAALSPLPAVVIVSSTHQGVRLRIDGSQRYLSAERPPVWRVLEPPGSGPRELLLVPGLHTMTAEAAGAAEAGIDLSLESGERVEVRIGAEGGRLALERFP
jgi:hypothetical protein